MPLFRYQCRSCGARFELLLPRFDAPAECPECGSAKLKKELNRIGAITSGGNAPCAMAHDCPSAAGGCCSCGCGHHHHHS